jgi:hypothetical protein
MRRAPYVIFFYQFWQGRLLLLFLNIVLMPITQSSTEVIPRIPAATGVLTGKNISTSEIMSVPEPPSFQPSKPYSPPGPGRVHR